MAAGMVNIGKRGGVASCSYILRNKECEAFVSNMGMEKIEILHLVNTYIDIEQSGSKELSIRANANPKLMTKLILSLPNENSTKENLGYLENVLEEIGIIDYPYVLAIHRGEKDGILNKHAHINFFERKFEKGNSNKNRLFNAKDFVSQVLIKYQKIFGLTANEKIRERIPRIEFQGHADTLKEIVSLDKAIQYEKRFAIAEILKEEDKIEAAVGTEISKPDLIESIELASIKMLETEPTLVIQMDELLNVAEEGLTVENIKLASVGILEIKPVIEEEELLKTAEKVQPVESTKLTLLEIHEAESIPVIQDDEVLEPSEKVLHVESIKLATVEIFENEATPVIQDNALLELVEEIQLIGNIVLAAVKILETEVKPVIQEDKLLGSSEKVVPVENTELALEEILETEATPFIQENKLLESSQKVKPVERIKLAPLEILETKAIPVIQKDELLEFTEKVMPIENIELVFEEILETEIIPVIQVDTPLETVEEVQLIENIELATVVEVCETESVQEIPTKNNGRSRRSTFRDIENDKTVAEIDSKPNGSDFELSDTELLEGDIIESRIDDYEPSGNNEVHGINETEQQADVGIDKQPGQVSFSDFKRTESTIEAEQANTAVHDFTEPRIEGIDLKGNGGRTVKIAKIIPPRTKTPEINVPDRGDENNEDDEPKKRKKGLRL